MKPAEVPRRRPEKMSGDADGMTTFRMMSRSVPRKEYPISLRLVGVLRTAPAVFSTMTGIAMMHTTKTFDVSPIP